jgi:hypothetical protein
MAEIEMVGAVAAAGVLAGPLNAVWVLSGNAAGKGTLVSTVKLRAFEDAGGAILGEMFSVDREGVEIPADVSTLANGDVPTWDEAADKFVMQPPSGSRGPHPEALLLAVSDEVNAITAGTGKLTFRMPFALTLTEVRANLKTDSSSGAVTVDINENGSSILSTKLTIDATEKTSTTAATPPVISDPDLADDAEITIDIDGAGTGAVGLKVTLIGERP